jgi:nicotinamidase/pyrazinamidase
MAASITSDLSLGKQDGLLIVDVQKDFLPGGSLAVRNGEKIIPALNKYLCLAASVGMAVIATRDWHPQGHSSFNAQGGPWPEHCIAGSPGAQFPEDLKLPNSVKVFSKGQAIGQDAYSGFDGTDLENFLRSIGILRLLIGGLATDYCVFHTVKDAISNGFRVLLLEDAIRAVDVKPGDGQKRMMEMADLGAHAVSLSDFRHDAFLMSAASV